MWRAGAHQPAPRHVSWAGKHLKIKQQVTRDRMSATATRGGKQQQQQQHEERGRKLFTSTMTKRILISQECERRDLGTFGDLEENENGFHDNKG